MPRAARCVLAGLPLHIVQRGINRNPCFFNDRDYTVYLRFLKDFSDEFACSVHAYCLMTNHVHLLITPSTLDGCALLMKKLGQCYVQYINHNLGRTGTLWEGRFRSCMVNSDDYVLACYRYIELNPVRAGMVPTPDQYPWSSYRLNAHTGLGGFITPHPAYEALGTEAPQRRSSYRQLCESVPPSKIVEEIRKATRLGVLAGALRRARGRPTRAK